MKRFHSMSLSAFGACFVAAALLLTPSSSGQQQLLDQLKMAEGALVDQAAKAVIEAAGDGAPNKPRGRGLKELVAQLKEPNNALRESATRALIDSDPPDAQE